MDRTALPAELAHFVQQALARGTYQSEEDLMAEAVRVLKASVSRQEAVQQPNGSTTDTPPRPRRSMSMPLPRRSTRATR